MILELLYYFIHSKSKARITKVNYKLNLAAELIYKY